MCRYKRGNPVDQDSELPNSNDAECDAPSLIEVELVPAAMELSSQAIEFLRDGRSRFKQIRCFGFVPSNYENAWNILNGLARGTFCEWGCGLGIVVGLAELLGFDASGIELEPELAESARALLRDHNLKAHIDTGSYFDSRDASDYHYVYSWPSQIPAIEKHFSDIATVKSKLLICYSQDELKCMAPR